MLSYLGPNGPSGPLASALPAAMPGSMPDAVPGIPSANQPPPPMPPIHAAPSTPIHNKGNGHTPASALAAIMRHAQNPGGPLAPTPPRAQYKAVTQADGSVLLHRMNPNGSPGPVVKVIPAIKESSK